MDGGRFHDNCNPGLFTLSTPFPPCPWKPVKSLLASAGHQAACSEPSPHGPTSSWWCFSSPSLQLFFLLVVAQPVQTTPLHPWPSLAPWLFLVWDRESHLHPGFSDVNSLATPQVQIWCIYLEEKQRKPTPPTAHNGNTPFLHPLWQIPAAPPPHTHCRSPRDEGKSAQVLESRTDGQ